MSNKIAIDVRSILFEDCCVSGDVDANAFVCCFFAKYSPTWISIPPSSNIPFTHPVYPVMMSCGLVLKSSVYISLVATKSEDVLR
jgi:hypothetical protein